MNHERRNDAVIAELKATGIKRQAAALSRMLAYAELDARDLNDEELSRAIRNVVIMISRRYDISEADLFRT
jgi:hypothetical protein